MENFSKLQASLATKLLSVGQKCKVTVTSVDENQISVIFNNNIMGIISQNLDISRDDIYTAEIESICKETGIVSFMLNEEDAFLLKKEHFATVKMKTPAGLGGYFDSGQIWYSEGAYPFLKIGDRVVLSEIKKSDDIFMALFVKKAKEPEKIDPLYHQKEKWTDPKIDAAYKNGSKKMQSLVNLGQIYRVKINNKVDNSVELPTKKNEPQVVGYVYPFIPTDAVKADVIVTNIAKDGIISCELVNAYTDGLCKKPSKHFKPFMNYEVFQAAKSNDEILTVGTRGYWVGYSYKLRIADGKLVFAEIFNNGKAELLKVDYEIDVDIKDEFGFIDTLLTNIELVDADKCHYKFYLKAL